MNAEQKKIIADMQSGAVSPVQVVSAANARTLVDGGFARCAAMSPAPEDGQQAINLTAKGRGFASNTRSTPASAPEPEVSADNSSDSE